MEFRLKNITYLLLVFPLLFIGCGKAVLDLEDETYEPKIVIDGYIMPNHKVDNIRISRNFPLNKEIDLMERVRVLERREKEI